MNDISGMVPSIGARARVGDRKLLVWLLLGSRAGDNNQLLALAEALGFPFEAKQLDFNQTRKIPFLRKGLGIVARRSRPMVKPPWPDLVICVGYVGVPVARHIREQTSGRAKLVHIGNPRDRLEDFDLQITTPQYARRKAPNLIELPFPIGNPAQQAEPTCEELEWLRDFPKPRRLVAIGGPARYWKLDHDALRNAVQSLERKEPAGSLIAVTSNRTTKSARRLLEALLGGEQQAVVDDHPSFGTLLAQCDEIYVTADSVSMLSEAVLSGKPVGMIPIKRSMRGRLNHWLRERPTGVRTFPDLTNFWNLLKNRHLVGTVEVPVVSQVCDTIDRAADAVRSLLVPGDVIDEAKP